MRGRKQATTPAGARSTCEQALRTSQGCMSNIISLRLLTHLCGLLTHLIVFDKISGRSSKAAFSVKRMLHKIQLRKEQTYCGGLCAAVMCNETGRAGELARSPHQLRCMSLLRHLLMCYCVQAGGDGARSRMRFTDPLPVSGSFGW